MEHTRMRSVNHSTLIWIACTTIFLFGNNKVLSNENFCGCIKNDPFYHCNCSMNEPKTIGGDTKNTILVYNEKFVFPPDVAINKIEKIILENISIHSLSLSSKWERLNRLYLNSCNITEIDDKAFANTTNLASISIENNKIRNISDHSFQYLTNLVQLILRNNSISEFPQVLLKSLSKLTYFNLEKNNVTILESNLFQRNLNLEEIDLNNNKIELLPSEIFNNLRNLQQIHLENNQIHELPDGIFENSQNLKIISLNNNKINSIDRNIFKNTFQLEELNLGGNYVKMIDLNFAQNLPNLKSIDVHILSNCDCKTKGTFQSCKQKTIAGNIECSNLKNRTFKELQLDDFNCKPEIIKCDQKEQQNRTIFLCVVQGDPKPNIRWTFKGKEIMQNNQYSLDVAQEATDQFVSKLIMELSQNTAGEYKIEADNIAGIDYKVMDLKYSTHVNDKLIPEYVDAPPNTTQLNTAVFMVSISILAILMIFILLVFITWKIRNRGHSGTYKTYVVEDKNRPVKYEMYNMAQFKENSQSEEESCHLQLTNEEDLKQPNLLHSNDEFCNDLEWNYVTHKSLEIQPNIHDLS